MRIITENVAIFIARVRHSLCRRLCPDLTFNSDMSRELDGWLDAYENACVEIERLKTLVDTSSDKEVRP